MESRIAQHRRLFMEAPDRLEEARRSYEEAQQIIRELAADANIPVPQDIPPNPDPDNILVHVESEAQESDRQDTPNQSHRPPNPVPTRRVRLRNYGQQLRSRIPPIPIRSNVQRMQSRFTAFRERFANQSRFGRLNEEDENAQ